MRDSHHVMFLGTVGNHRRASVRQAVPSPSSRRRALPGSPRHEGSAATCENGAVNSVGRFETATILGLPTRLQRVSAPNALAPPVIVLHGWGAHIEAVSPIVRFLGDRTNVVAVDLPGFGESRAPSEAWGVADYGRFVLAVAAHCELERFSLVAHSFGARIAIFLTSGETDRVVRMVLTGAAGIKPRRAPAYYAKVALAKAGRGAAAVGGQPGRRLQEHIRRQVASDDWLSVPETMRDTLRRVLSEDLTTRLDQVAVPTLLVWGQDDQDTPLWMGKVMESHIPDAGLVVIPNAGHYAYADQPGQFNAIVDQFLVTQLRDAAGALK
jgi:pimeloyl-ACP methyl ester carboxylesterase